MKKLHIINIGYPKCGTTWLWDTLTYNSVLADHPIKENQCLITGTSVADYCKQYTEEVTGNFAPNNFALDQYIIEQLADIPQVRASIILRDPLQLLWSMYVYINVENTKNIDFQTFCYTMYDSKWFTSTSLVIERWKKHFGNRFNVFWYDDLKTDNLNFYLKYCKIMQLSPGNAKMLDKINVTGYQKPIPVLDQDLLDLINAESNKLARYKL